MQDSLNHLMQDSLNFQTAKQPRTRCPKSLCIQGRGMSEGFSHAPTSHHWPLSVTKGRNYYLRLDSKPCCT